MSLPSAMTGFSPRQQVYSQLFKSYAAQRAFENARGKSGGRLGIQDAYRVAKLAQKDYDLDWTDGGKRHDAVKYATFNQGGFDIRFEVSYDEWLDASDMYEGHFSSEWEKTAVPSSSFINAMYHQSEQDRRGYLRYTKVGRIRIPRRLASRRYSFEPEYSRRHEGRDSRYFVPGEEVCEIAKAYNGRMFGMSRHNAYLRAWEQIREQEEMCGSDELQAYVVEVTVSYNGVELARENCGTTVYGDDEHLTDIAYDLLSEALDHAVEALPGKVFELRSKADGMTRLAETLQELAEMY